jgi:hypothetical protein
MKNNLITLSVRGLGIVAITTLLPLGAAFAASSGSVSPSDASKFNDWIATAVPATASPFENGQYEKLNLSVLGDIAWVPKSHGVQGPVRLDPAVEEAVRRQEAYVQDIQRRLGPVGGVGTF